MEEIHAKLWIVKQFDAQATDAYEKYDNDITFSYKMNSYQRKIISKAICASIQIEQEESHPYKVQLKPEPSL